MFSMSQASLKYEEDNNKTTPEKPLLTISYERLLVYYHHVRTNVLNRSMLLSVKL